MSILKKLATQTAIYGISSIFGRFLNYLLVPLYTYYFTPAEYGVVSEFYAYAGFFSVLLLFGFETGYFRFRDKANPVKDVAYSTALIFVVAINLLFLLFILTINTQLSAALNYANHPEYVLCFALIFLFDAVSAIPFARLRAENRPFYFAGLKVFSILTTIALSLFFIVYCPKALAQNPQSWVTLAYDSSFGIGYIFIANLAASLLTFVLLIPLLWGMRWGFDRVLFGQMLRYSLPMVVIGFAGVINEMLDRALLKYLLPFDTQTNLKMLGIYSACYKLSILMSLFIQAFRFAAEPFFFSYADKSDARKVYADVLNVFVIFCVFIFLLVTLYIDFFQYFVGAEFRAGLQVVPILLLANLFLGIYVNLSIWYKLTDRTLLGAMVSLSGAGLTVGLNLMWIPLFGYVGSAWATLVCYASMALVSYLLGRHYYPVAYDLKRIAGYISLGIGLYFAQRYLLTSFNQPPWVLATALISLYGLSVMLFEGRKVKS
ncbi:MAG: oligosaccharide flippase family protein [Methylococcaceae bacterium]|nr:oligosaccharide flippase family protein [Methylococcaceae bacterium]